jgi:hypothetical protein
MIFTNVRQKHKRHWVLDDLVFYPDCFYQLSFSCRPKERLSSRCVNARRLAALAF